MTAKSPCGPQRCTAPPPDRTWPVPHAPAQPASQPACCLSLTSMLSRLARNQEDWANRKSPASTATRVPNMLFTVSLPATHAGAGRAGTAGRKRGLCSRGRQASCQRQPDCSSPVVGWRQGHTPAHTPAMDATRTAAWQRFCGFTAKQLHLVAERLASWCSMRAGTEPSHAVPPVPSGLLASPPQPHHKRTCRTTPRCCPPQNRQQRVRIPPKQGSRAGLLARAVVGLFAPRRTSHSSSTSSCTRLAVCSISLISASRRCRSVMSLQGGGGRGKWVRWSAGEDWCADRQISGGAGGTHTAHHGTRPIKPPQRT